MRTKIIVTVVDPFDGSHHQYRTTTKLPSTFKQIQYWESRNMVDIPRGDHTLYIPWERVLHIRVPSEQT